MKPIKITEGKQLPKKKKSHAADTADDESVLNAASFSVYFMKGPFERYQEEVLTLKEAYSVAKRMNEEHGKVGGRRACIYALVPHYGKLQAVVIRAQEPPDGWEKY